MKRRIWILGALFLLAFVLRFYSISKGPFHYDALDLAMTAQKTLDTMQLHYEHGAGYPLTVICTAVLIAALKLFGIVDPVFCANLLSVLAGALGVVLLVLLVERLFDFHRAVLSGLLLACFLPHAAISTYGKSLTLGICLALASAYWMVCYIQERRASQLVFSALFLGLCAAARLPDVLVVVPISFLFFTSPPASGSRLKAYVAFGFIAVLTVLLYYLPMFFRQGLSQFTYVLTTESQAKYLGPFSYLNKAALRFLIDQMTPLGVILALAGFGVMLIKREIRAFCFCALWFVVFQLSYGNFTHLGPRLLVIAWVPLVVAQASYLGSLKGRVLRLTAYVLIFYLVIPPVLANYHALAFRHKRALQAEFARWVSREVGRDAVVIALDEDLFLRYYGSVRTLERPVTCDAQRMEDFFREEVDARLEAGEEVYVIDTAIQPYDVCRLFKKGLVERYRLVMVGERLNEDWHHAFLKQVLFKEGLYRIQKKTQKG